MNKKVMSTILILGIAISIVGCGAKEKNNTEVKSSTQQEQTKEINNNSKKDFNTVEELFNNPIFKKQLDKEANGKAEILAKDNELTYIFKQKTQIKVTKEFKDALKKQLKSQEAQFKNIAKSLIEDVNTNEITIKLKYENADGSEIYTHIINYKN